MHSGKFGTVVSFDFETSISSDALPEVTGKLCFVEIDGEEFLEIKTLGPVDEAYNEDDLQVIRLSKRAFEELKFQWESFSANAQTH